MSIQICDRGPHAARSTAAIVAPILGWDRVAIDCEIGHYDARLSAELERKTQPDDRTADAARMGAADVRRLALDSASGVIASYENASVVSLDDRRRAD
jgi:glycerol-3-phosphate dehydrogenase